MNKDIPFRQSCREESYTYCIRCGKVLRQSKAYYSKYDPDHEESMCLKCYKRHEKLIESED